MSLSGSFQPFHLSHAFLGRLEETMHDTRKNPPAKEPSKANNGRPYAHCAVWHPDRARQFMPFAALRGFDEMLREQERLSALQADPPLQDSVRLP